MTDPMELVGRLDMIAAELQGLPHVTATVTEAAACIREMVEAQKAMKTRLDLWEPKLFCEPSVSSSRSRT